MGIIFTLEKNRGCRSYDKDFRLQAWGLICSWLTEEKISEWFCSSGLLYPLFSATPESFAARTFWGSSVCRVQIRKPLFKAYPWRLLSNFMDWIEEMQFSDSAQLGAVSAFKKILIGMEVSHWSPTRLHSLYSYTVFLLLWESHCCQVRITNKVRANKLRCVLVVTAGLLPYPTFTELLQCL